MRDQFGDVRIERREHVAVVEINRGPHNFVTVGLMRDLADALEAVDAEPYLRCSVLTSTGKSFCAGADLTSSIGEGQSQDDGIKSLYGEAVRLFSVRKPIVAAIQGAAIGAGLGLALVADFRVAAHEARFSANFVKLGFHPGFGLTYTLPRLIGHQKASLLFLTGRRIKPDEALAWGLIDEIVRLEWLVDESVRLANEIAENAPLAVQATRATLRAELAEHVRAQTAKEFALQAELRKTADYAEGVKAVNERRPGKFTGR